MSRRSASAPGARGIWLTPLGVPATWEYFDAVQEEVTSWWWQHQRKDLPWRPPPPADHTDVSSRAAVPLCDPYRVWVSEVMSQQTRMDTVITYYNAWMKKFPSIDALAASTEDEVKAVWAGMGYYRRAMYLRKGAQYLQVWSRAQAGDNTSTGAAFTPSTQQELLKVPGVGPYTSAAIASMCFGEPVCSVDGNVIRVLSRLRGERDFDPKVSANVKQATVWGQELMGAASVTSAATVCTDPKALNQGLMELGASVCRPGGAPLCALCPLQAHCRARALLQCGDIEAIEGIIPVRAAALAKRLAHEVCVVHEIAADAGGGPRRFVVVRRPADGLLGGMLEFPTVSVLNAGTEEAPGSGDEGVAEEVPPSQLLTHPLSRLTWKARAKPTSVRACGSVRHVFSHILMNVTVVHVQWPSAADGAALMCRIAEVLDAHVAKSTGASFPSAARTSLMSEDELRRNAPSRLMLKVLDSLTRSSAKRGRAGGARAPAASGEAALSVETSRKKTKRGDGVTATRCS